MTEQEFDTTNWNDVQSVDYVKNLRTRKDWKVEHVNTTDRTLIVSILSGCVKETVHHLNIKQVNLKQLTT